MSGCTAVPPISSSSSIDMAPESNPNTHLRLNPNSSSTSPSSSSTSSPSSRPLHHPNNIYFQPRPSPIPSEEHLIRKSNLRSHDGSNRQNNIHNRSERLFQENGKTLDMPTSENENCQLLLIASESK